MSKQSKEYNHAYNSGFYAGQAAIAASVDLVDDDVSTFALAELACILDRSEGYLRVGHSPAGLVWARWKWTAGPLEGHYTFGSDQSLPVALAQVCSRVHECEQGKRKPTRDTGYKRR